MRSVRLLCPFFRAGKVDGHVTHDDRHLHLVPADEVARATGPALNGDAARALAVLLAACDRVIDELAGADMQFDALAEHVGSVRDLCAAALGQRPLSGPRDSGDDA